MVYQVADTCNCSADTCTDNTGRRNERAGDRTANHACGRRHSADALPRGNGLCRTAYSAKHTACNRPPGYPYPLSGGVERSSQLHEGFAAAIH